MALLAELSERDATGELARIYLGETLPKVRAVDPPVLTHGTVSPLSALDIHFAKHRKAYIKDKQGEWYLRIIDPR